MIKIIMSKQQPTENKVRGSIYVLPSPIRSKENSSISRRSLDDIGVRGDMKEIELPEITGYFVASVSGESS